MKKFIIILTFFISCAQTDDTINIPTSINYTVTNIHQTEFVPWSIEFIDKDTFLYTERRGKMFIVSDGQSTEISNIPSVYQKNQGGLLDIELHPNFDQNNTLFFSFSKGNEEDGANTAIASAKLIDNSLQEVEILYVGKEMTSASLHFGSRLQFDDEGYLYFTIGDRGNRNKNPQDITRDAGKVYRINDDGSIPESNPFFDDQGARKAIFSYGHRNPQGMFKHPETGKIWTNEHGPRGGDEINIIEAGKNYGWPKITYGINYSGTTITNDKSLPGLEQPMYYWLPSIAPSGFAYLNSDIYDDWKGSLLVGSLKFMYLERLVLANNKVTYREKVAENIGRVRDVKVSPDGFIYLAVDNKGVFKLIPK
jgi:glucose/arabinose dehydrogenase